MPRAIRLLLVLSTAFATSAEPSSPTTSHPWENVTGRRRRRRRSSRSGAGSSSLDSAAFASTRSSGGRVLRAAGKTDADASSAPSGVGSIDGGPDEDVDRRLRFGGVARLYANGDATVAPGAILDRLASATVAVVGLGGVGSWAAEALCRSGVGSLILVDLDDVCVSNTNRQLHATSSSVGRMKIDETRRRLVDINPACDVTLVHDFVTAENANILVEDWSSSGPTACIDAIDGMHEKAALILACVAHRVPIVTCGGAAGRTDPARIAVDDLTRVREDRLLFQVRKLLRQRHGFPKVDVPRSGAKNARVRRWRIPAVYSTEVQQKAATSPDEGASSFRACDGALGTACFVTGAYGLAAARTVVEMIALDGLVVPKKLGR